MFGNNLVIAAGIVTFNPDIEELNITVDKIREQVDFVIICDNASVNIEEVSSICDNYNPAVMLIKNKKNQGIAKALNQIMGLSKQMGAKWVLTLDQDSNIDREFVPEMMKTKIDGKTGIICPRIFDEVRKREDLQDKTHGDCVRVLCCITSGSIINIDKWEQVGGFDEFLFIDGVDFEFCDRLIDQGYNIVKNQLITLHHKMGNRISKKLFWKDIYYSSHNEMRIYYIARNRLYRDYKRSGKLHIKSFLSVIRLMIMILIFEEQKSKKMHSLFRGVKDGMKVAGYE